MSQLLHRICDLSWLQAYEITCQLGESFSGVLKDFEGASSRKAMAMPCTPVMAGCSPLEANVAVDGQYWTWHQRLPIFHHATERSDELIGDIGWYWGTKNHKPVAIEICTPVRSKHCFFPPTQRKGTTYGSSTKQYPDGLRFYRTKAKNCRLMIHPVDKSTFDFISRINILIIAALRSLIAWVCWLVTWCELLLEASWSVGHHWSWGTQKCIIWMKSMWSLGRLSMAKMWLVTCLVKQRVSSRALRHCQLCFTKNDGQKWSECIGVP